MRDYLFRIVDDTWTIIDYPSTKYKNLNEAVKQFIRTYPDDDIVEAYVVDVMTGGRVILANYKKAGEEEC